MTLETSSNTPARAQSPRDRKRHSSSEPVPVTNNQSKVTDSATKRAKPTVSNDGWGDLFKSREHFVEMHVC